MLKNRKWKLHPRSKTRDCCKAQKFHRWNWGRPWKWLVHRSSRWPEQLQIVVVVEAFHHRKNNSLSEKLQAFYRIMKWCQYKRKTISKCNNMILINKLFPQEKCQLENNNNNIHRLCMKNKKTPPITNPLTITCSSSSILVSMWMRCMVGVLEPTLLLALAASVQLTRTIITAIKSIAFLTCL